MALSHFSHVKVSGILCVVPEKSINIDDEISFYEDASKLERNKKILGLGTRHVVPDGVTASNLAEEAAKHLISKMNIDISEIDTLIMTSINHDYLGSSDACIIQGNLGLSEECACFDTSGLGCTDSVYGLWLAHALIESGASKKCLFLEASTSSLICDVKNRHSNMLFGDGAAAVLLERSEKERKAYFHLKSIGKEWKSIVTPAGGFKFPIKKDIIDVELKDTDGNIIHLWDSTMKGGEVFRFVMENAPDSIDKVLDFSKKEREEIDYFAIHQANGQIVRTVIGHSQIPKTKASSESFTKFGNCGGTSVLIDLCYKNYDKKLNDVLCVTFGVGLSVGSCIINMEETYNGGVLYLPNPANFPTREEQVAEWIKFLTN